jgi:hypothetical protein
MMMLVPGRAATALAIAVVVVAASGCRGADTPETVERNPVVEAFWEDFRAASAARGAGDLERAALLYERALTADPDHGDSLYYLGHFRYSRGEVARALELFEHLAQVQPARVRSWQQLSLVRGQNRPGWLGNLAGAQAAAQEAVELIRGESLNFELLARWAAYDGDAAAAREYLGAAVGHNPNSPQAADLTGWLDTPPPAGPDERLLVAQLMTDGRTRRLDLDADGQADLAGIDSGGGRLLLVVPRGDSGTVLPGRSPVNGWARSRAADDAAPVPLPVTAVVAGRDRVVVVGGGVDGARVFAATNGLYQEIAGPALPGLVGAPVLAAADFNGDGHDDLAIGNMILDPDTEALGGRILLGTSGDEFRVGADLPGPVSWLATGDYDGDGDVDLVVARVAEDTASAAAEGDHAPTPVRRVGTTLTLLRNDEGSLVPEHLLDADGIVQDVVLDDLDGDGHIDLFVATAGPAPERPMADALWLGSATGLVPASERLSEPPGATYRAWNSARGLVLLRGGSVPGEPRVVVTVPLR